jgi:hypothetical protein
MLVATRSFTADYGDERVQIVAGRTFIDPDHALARAYPDDWQVDPEEVERADRAEGNGTRTRSAGGTPRRRLSREQELEVRAARLREIEQREAAGWRGGEGPAGGLSRALGPETREERNERVFWDGINAMLWPDAEREQRESTEFYDEMKAVETRLLAAEREALSDWLDRQ